MKKHRMPEMKEGGVNVTPLIDVVMCLIIFFMLVAKIGVSTGAKPMELPQTIAGKKIEELGDSIVLNIYDPTIDRDANGLPLRDEQGKPKHIAAARAALNMPEVWAALDEKDTGKAEKIEVSAPPNSFPLRTKLIAIYENRKRLGKEKDFSVTVRAEKDLPFSMLQVVLAEIATAGIRNVNYGAKKNTGPAPAAEAAAE
jgi:biopolymer transport protein ExbD